MDKSQLMKGILESCILKIIEKYETYGYEIVVQLQNYGFGDMKEGTIYPLLLRLEKKNLITATFKESPLGKIIPVGVNIDRTTFVRKPHTNLSLVAFAYSLYIPYAPPVIVPPVTSISVSDQYGAL